jgi:hypothetical protein
MNRAAANLCNLKKRMKTLTSYSTAGTARSLFAYGAFLFGIAVVAVMYDPASGQFGFNAAAQTALISGGICGGLSILWGFLLPNHRWPIWAALGSTGLFLAAFVWRSAVSWTAFAGGAAEKWYAGTLITMMALASVALLARLWRAHLSGQPDDSPPMHH